MIKIREDGQVHMGAINLEGCTDAELVTITAHPAPHADIKLMAAMLLRARQSRLEGRTDTAMKLEARFERLYATLPKRLKW